MRRTSWCRSPLNETRGICRDVRGRYEGILVNNTADETGNGTSTGNGEWQCFSVVIKTDRSSKQKLRNKERCVFDTVFCSALVQPKTSAVDLMSSFLSCVHLMLVSCQTTPLGTTGQKTRSSEFYGTLMVASSNILLPVRHIVHVFPECLW